LAEEMVEELTAMPDGPALEIAIIDARLQWVEGEISGLDPAHQEARPRILEQRKSDLEWEKSLLLESKEPSRLPLSLDDLDLDALPLAEEAPRQKALEFQESFREAGKLLRAVQKTKYVDAIARSDLGHQGDMRAKVRQVNLFGQYRQAR